MVMFIKIQPDINYRLKTNHIFSFLPSLAGIFCLFCLFVIGDIYQLNCCLMTFDLFSFFMSDIHI